MIKSIALCGNNQCNRATKEEHDMLIVGTMDMVHRLTFRRPDLDEIPHRQRNEAWPAGVYNHIDQVIVSNPASDDHKQFKAVFEHRHPHFESYTVEFHFIWNKLEWLCWTIKLLQEHQIEAVKVVFDDNSLGQFLMQNWANTSYVPINALDKLFVLAADISDRLEELSLDPIWIEGCKKNKAGNIKSQIALMALIANVAQSKSQDLRKFHSIG